MKGRYKKMKHKCKLCGCESNKAGKCCGKEMRAVRATDRKRKRRTK